MKRKKKRKWTAMVSRSRLFEQVATAFIVIAGLYLSVLGIAAGLASLLGDAPLMSDGASVALIGYGAYAVSEMICFITGSKSLMIKTIDMLVKIISED